MRAPMHVFALYESWLVAISSTACCATVVAKVSTFILDLVYKIYIGWFVPAKDPMYITFEASFQHKVKYTRGK